MQTSSTENKNARDYQWDLSPFWAYFTLFAIILFSQAFLTPALKLYYHGDTFGLFLAPALNSIDDIPEMFRYASEAYRFIQHGIFYSVGQGLWGGDPFKWHLVALILGAIDGILLFFLLSALLRDRLAALIGTGLFSLSGALYYAQAWVAGTAETISALFVFSATLIHVMALDKNASRGQVLTREIIAIFLLWCAFATKETMLPVVIIWILIDLYIRRRLTLGGIGAILLGINTAWLTYLKASTILEQTAYTVDLSLSSLGINLVAFFFDPLLATGAEFYILNNLGHSGGKQATVGVILEWLKANPVLGILLVLIILTIVVSWIILTLAPKWFPLLKDSKPRALVPRSVGWIGWLLVLMPTSSTPGHHYPYYVLVPIAFLMLCVGPALASGLRNTRTRVFIIIGLVLYIIWYPINTHLAFKHSNQALGAASIHELVEAVREMDLEIPPEGLHIVVDGSDHILHSASLDGHALRWNFPGMKPLMVENFQKYLDENGELAFDNSDEWLVVRKVDGEWREVTEEFELIISGESDP